MAVANEHHIHMSKSVKNRYIFPTDKALSFEAKGLLGLMLNYVDCDYCSRGDLYREFPNNSEQDVDKAISELCRFGYIVEFQQNRFAVNKTMIPYMRIVE